VQPQTPAVPLPPHESTPVHSTQSSPSVPQAPLSVPARQVPPLLQQPPQLVASQTHAPSRHRCPLAQAKQSTPPVPQNPRSVPARQALPLQQPLQLSGSQTHCPSWHVCPSSGQGPWQKPPHPSLSPQAFSTQLQGASVVVVVVVVESSQVQTSPLQLHSVPSVQQMSIQTFSLWQHPLSKHTIVPSVLQSESD
jgi:hypothetical protein